MACPAAGREPEVEPMGRLLLIIGLVIAGIGLLISLGLPLGRLPGDVSWRRGNFTFYAPLATCVVLSIVLTILFALFRR
jgi:predicted MFS family arabinose efflux permease